MPEWYLIVAALAVLSVLGLSWRPLLLALPLFAVATALPVLQAIRAAAGAQFESRSNSPARMLGARAYVAFLHLVQPAARLRGRLEYGLTWWRRPVTAGLAALWARAETVWTESWRGPATWLRAFEERLQRAQTPSVAGGDYDAWDLEAGSGAFGRVRVTMLLEEHGAGRQLARFRLRPRFTLGSALIAALCVALAAGAGIDRAWPACAVLATAGLAIALRGSLEAATVMQACRRAIQELREVFNRQR
jgi:hypothetical protein